MLKALLMASVIIGAFLFQPAAYSQESGSNPCPFGGDLLDGMCTMSAPSGTLWTATVPFTNYSTATRPSKTEAANHAVQLWASELSPPIDTSNSMCITTESYSATASYNSETEIATRIVTITITSTTRPGYLEGSCSPSRTITNTESQPVIFSESEPQYYCPPDGFSQFNQGPFVTSEGQNLCFYPAATPDNDNECPPGTIGGCDEPPEEPGCSIGGNGMEVCPADPNEKCSSYQHEGKTFYDCPSNCGFIQDQFFCTTEPDSDGEIPDMSKCFKVATGWACPPDSPTPDDNIDNPNKPLPDMTKGDFKETNKGIEIRLNATNKLLGDLTGIGAANNQALADLNAKQLAANGFLRDIRQNTADTAKNTGDIKDALTGDELVLEEDTAQSILDGLGLTGDEKFSDLEKEVISLDSYRSQFTWSAGSSSCPPDRSMNLLGSSFLIDWQPYCDAFGVLGYFIEAAALLLSGFIAFGVRK